jgi:VIT1/CCC1 family predicted Fe2+/Mn2+ transporter
MVGLHSGTHSKSAVLGGILTIAVADSFSDALGIHISEESEGIHTTKEIWISTIATFVAKMLFALTFTVPVLLFPLLTAIIVSLGWGVMLLVVLSYHIAKSQGINHRRVILEHITIIVVVVSLTHIVGNFIAGFVE